MECQLKCPSPHNKVCGLLTNKAVSDQALVVVGDTVRFAPANYLDPKQLWTKLYLLDVKDSQGNLVFMLVNGGNGFVNGANVFVGGKAVKAIQHSPGPNMPVRVVDLKFDPSNIMKDSTLLWTENDGRNGFIVIRESKNNDALVLDAQNREPVPVVAAKYNGGDSQLWKFMPNNV